MFQFCVQLCHANNQQPLNSNFPIESNHLFNSITHKSHKRQPKPNCALAVVVVMRIYYDKKNLEASIRQKFNLNFVANPCETDQEEGEEGGIERKIRPERM